MGAVLSARQVQSVLRTVADLGGNSVVALASASLKPGSIGQVNNVLSHGDALALAASIPACICKSSRHVVVLVLAHAAGTATYWSQVVFEKEYKP